MLTKILLVGLGGGAGSILRFLASAYINRWNITTFPLGTFLVNVMGCLIIGFLLGVTGKAFNEDIKLLLVTGFCGGYTTFSTFSSENLFLLQNGNYLMLVIYILASIIIGLLAVWFGVFLASLINR